MSAEARCRSVGGAAGSRPALRGSLTLLAALALGAFCVPLQAQLSPLNPTVDQGSELSFVFTQGGCNGAKPAPAGEWTYTTTGPSGGTFNSYGGWYQVINCVTMALATPYVPGTYQFTLLQNGVAVAATTITVRPIVITISGPQQMPQYAIATYTATVTGIIPSLSGVSWSVVPAGLTLEPNGSSVAVTTGGTAGTYQLLATSTWEPAVTYSFALTVLPPPVTTITPASVVTSAGVEVPFSASVINASSNVVGWYTNDPDGFVNATGDLSTAYYFHYAGKPGGHFYVQAQSYQGGNLAIAPVSVVTLAVAPAVVTVPPGTSRQFSAEVTGSQQAVQWSTTVPGATVASGLLQVPANAAAGSYTVLAQTVGAPAASALATVTVASAIPVSGVAVSPALSVIDSGQQEPFSAVVEGQNGEPNPNQAVSWSVSGPASASIAANGLFTAPTAPGTYTVTATAAADATQSGSATVRVGEDLMVLPSFASLAPGASETFAAQVSGVANPAVAWSVEEGSAGGAISAGGLYTAPAAPGVYHVLAVSSASGDPVQGIATVVVTGNPQVAVTVSPPEALVPAGGTQQFTATVSGAADTGVVWSASAGTIDQTGLFTAPAAYGTVTITASSHAAPQAQAQATAVVSNAGGAQAFQYDANGNLLSDGTRTYEWDAENRLSAINIGTHRSELGYDGLGRRVMIVEIDNGNVTAKHHYIWIGDQMVEERDATATAATIPTTLAAGSPIAATESTSDAEARSELVASPVTDAAPTPAGDNAAFIAQTVPATMVAGGVYSVSITLQNTGTTTWTAAANYRLGSVNPQNNTTWGVERAYLAVGDSIAPGQQKTFTFNVTAPATAGTYNFQWQLIEENVAWIGDPAPNLSITVAAGATANLAQYIAQSVPTTMVAGAVYTVSVTMQNAGTNVWTPSSNHHLGAQDPEDNTTWRGNRVFLSAGDSIAQGQQKTFVFTVTAPATPGTYNFQWQMVQEGVAWFGDLTPAVAISVVAGSTTQLAQFISQSVPAVMSVGMSYTITVTYENAGTAAWTAAAGYRLGSANPANNLTWGLNRVYLASTDSIAQGQEKTFTFTVTAPTVPGTYNFQWQMIQENVAWFGDLTPNLQIVVVVPPEPILADYYPGGIQFAGANYYFSYDHLGSIREVTDANGTPVARYDYDPYGRQTVVQGAAFELGYAGYFNHLPSGLYLTKYRAYDPDLGRWASRDWSGSTGARRYSYSDNDPENLYDPDGFSPKPPPPPGGYPPTYGPVGPDGQPKGPPTNWGRWKWAPNPADSRGGKWKIPGKAPMECSYHDEPKGDFNPGGRRPLGKPHWDVIDGEGKPFKVDEYGNPVSNDQAHPRLPTQPEPVPPAPDEQPWIWDFPWDLVAPIINPCLFSPLLPGCSLSSRMDPIHT